MAKVIGVMLTIWGFIMTIFTFFNFLSGPGHISYNEGLKYSTIASGITLAFALGIFMLVAGIGLLATSWEPREV